MMQPQTLPEALTAILAEDIPMADALGAYASEVRRLSPTFASAYDTLIARLREGDVGAGAPREGDVLPDFVLPDQHGRLRTLADFTRDGPAVISINRGHWCPSCRIELSALARLHAQVAKQGVQIVSIMPERQPFTRIVQERGVEFPVLTDIDDGYALTLGLAFWIGDDLEALMTGAGRLFPSYQGNDGWFLPAPATFVVGRDGRVLARHVDPASGTTGWRSTRSSRRCVRSSRSESAVSAPCARRHSAFGSRVERRRPMSSQVQLCARSSFISAAPAPERPRPATE